MRLWIPVWRRNCGRLKTRPSADAFRRLFFSGLVEVCAMSYPPNETMRETLPDMMAALGFVAAITVFFELWWVVTDLSEQNWVAAMQALPENSLCLMSAMGH